MGKLCPRGKAAAKRKFKVYPSAYANMYASTVCSGKVTPGGKSKSQKRKASSPQRKANGGRMVAAGCGDVMEARRKETKLPFKTSV